MRNDKRMQEILPKTHMRNVRTGNEWSSVVGTVSATSRIGEFSSSSSASSSLLETGVSSVVSHDEDDDADDAFVGSLAFVTVKKCLLVFRYPFRN